MIQKIRHIMDSLEDIKKIMYYCFDTIDYTTYIKELNNIIENLSEMLNSCNNEADYETCALLMQTAETYLKKAKSLQRIYEKNLPKSEEENEKGQ